MIVVESKSELRSLINKRIEEQGPNCDLNDIDVSRVSDMSYLFYNLAFEGDISKWDVSQVKDMTGMFSHSTFNGDISSWDVSNVRDAYGMFFNSKFGGDIRDWNIDISYVEDMCSMFRKSPLEGREPLWYIIWCGGRF